MKYLITILGILIVLTISGCEIQLPIKEKSTKTQIEAKYKSAAKKSV